MNPVPLFVIAALLILGTFLTVAYLAAHALRDVRRIHRTWQQQIPGLERIPLCTLCRVITHPGGTERVPCKWHADMVSVAIEERLTP